MQHAGFAMSKGLGGRVSVPGGEASLSTRASRSAVSEIRVSSGAWCHQAGPAVSGSPIVSRAIVSSKNAAATQIR
jgi:hypothetical protein